MLFLVPVQKPQLEATQEAHVAKMFEATCSMVFVSKETVTLILRIWSFKTSVLSHATQVKWGLVLLVPIRSLKADQRSRGVNIYDSLNKRWALKVNFYGQSRIYCLGMEVQLPRVWAAMQFPEKFQV